MTLKPIRLTYFIMQRFSDYLADLCFTQSATYMEDTIHSISNIVSLHIVWQPPCFIVFEHVQLMYSLFLPRYECKVEAEKGVICNKNPSYLFPLLVDAIQIN